MKCKMARNAIPWILDIEDANFKEMLKLDLVRCLERPQEGLSVFAKFFDIIDNMSIEGCKDESEFLTRCIEEYKKTEGGQSGKVHKNNG